MQSFLKKYSIIGKNITRKVQGFLNKGLILTDLKKYLFTVIHKKANPKKVSDYPNILNLMFAEYYLLHVTKKTAKEIKYIINHYC